MFSSLVSIGQALTAAQVNNMRKDGALFSGDEVNITYNNDDTIATVEHVDFGVTLTFTYNTNQTVSSVTDGTNTWNFTYDTRGRLTKILKA